MQLYLSKFSLTSARHQCALSISRMYAVAPGILLHNSNHDLSPAIGPQAYPWLHATAEGCKFGYQLLYLLEATPYYSQDLAILRQTVVRVSGTDLVRLRIPRLSSPNFQNNMIISLSCGT